MTARDKSVPAGRGDVRSGNGPVRGSGPGGAITREDIAGKLRTISGQAGEQIEASRPAATWALAAAVGVAVVGAYLWGRRRGRRSRAVVEIRRV